MALALPDSPAGRRTRSHARSPGRPRRPFASACVAAGPAGRPGACGARSWRCACCEGRRGRPCWVRFPGWRATRAGPPRPAGRTGRTAAGALRGGGRGAGLGRGARGVHGAACGTHLQTRPGLTSRLQRVRRGCGCADSPTARQASQVPACTGCWASAGRPHLRSRKTNAAPAPVDVVGAASLEHVRARLQTRVPGAAETLGTPAPKRATMEDRSTSSLRPRLDPVEGRISTSASVVSASRPTRLHSWQAPLEPLTGEEPPAADARRVIRRLTY